jgi:SAM-dependent methyltransferase
MSRADRQRRHYDDLVRHERATRYLLSCGFRDRFDPALAERRPTLRRAVERLFDQLLPGPAGAVLDLGCGTGWYWPIVAPRCRRLVGLELSAEMAACGLRHRAARSGPAGEVVCGTTVALPFASASFDVVLAIDALHHVADLDVTLREARRVLAPGGRLIAVEPNVLNPLVLVAHLVPPEERGALWPNHPWAVAAALRRAFDEVETAAVTYVSGVEHPAALRVVELLAPAFARPPLSAVALRRVSIARRR